MSLSIHQIERRSSWKVMIPCSSIRSFELLFTALFQSEIDRFPCWSREYARFLNDVYPLWWFIDQGKPMKKLFQFIECCCFSTLDPRTTFTRLHLWRISNDLIRSLPFLSPWLFEILLVKFAWFRFIFLLLLLILIKTMNKYIYEMQRHDRIR